MYPIHDVAILCPSDDLQQQQQQQQPGKQKPIPLNIEFSVWHTFKHHIPRFVVTILVDVILPLVIYVLLQKHTRPVYALLVAGSPPLLMVIFKGVWLCTFDALGFLVFLSFIVTAMVAVISRNPFIILLEKSLITGILSFIFGVTLIPFRCCKHRCRWRPMAYYFYQDLVPTKRAEIGLPDRVFTDRDEQIDDRYAQIKDEVSIENLSHKEEVALVYEWLYAHCSSFRFSCKLITSIWSVGYLSEFLVRVTLILAHFSINKIVIYGHLILSFITVLMILSTIVCITIERKYTLAFIERWRMEHFNVQQQRRRLSDLSHSVVLVNCDSNCILSVHT